MVVNACHGIGFLASSRPVRHACDFWTAGNEIGYRIPCRHLVWFPDLAAGAFFSGALTAALTMACQSPSAASPTTVRCCFIVGLEAVIEHADLMRATAQTCPALPRFRTPHAGLGMKRPGAGDRGQWHQAPHLVVYQSNLKPLTLSGLLQDTQIANYD